MTPTIESIFDIAWNLAFEKHALAMELIAAKEKIVNLEKELAEARETIEDVCIGTAIQCPTCNKWKPCMCDK